MTSTGIAFGPSLMRKAGLALCVLASLCAIIPAPTASAEAAVRQTGIATGASLHSMDAQTLENRLQDIRQLGAQWLRVDFNWSEIQATGPNEYNWGPYDRTLEAASRHDLRVLVTLGYTPGWARQQACAARHPSEAAGRTCSPGNPADFARFAKAAANRYHNRGIDAWEIWNEPNLTGYWKTLRRDGRLFIDGGAYAQTANAAARAIRSQDADAFIITGGMAPVFEKKYARGLRQSDFLRSILPLLDKNLFSAVGIHPYSWPKLPRQKEVYNSFYTVDHGKAEYNLRTVMARAGWGSKQIWATEFGASTKGTRLHTNHISLHVGRPDHVTEERQAQITRQGVESWYKKDNVGPIFVHADSDRWLETRKNEGGFGLRRNDGSKKPAYDAFQESTTKIKR